MKPFRRFAGIQAKSGTNSANGAGLPAEQRQDINILSFSKGCDVRTVLFDVYDPHRVSADTYLS